MSNIVTFNNHNIELINHNNQNYMTQRQIAVVLDFKSNVGVSDLYNAHKEEFDDEMSCLIKHGRTRTRIFNREGAWLIGMFARTPKAAAFRKWVLKVLGAVADSETPKQVQGDTTTVREHKRALPSGKKEIVLSAKAKEEVGGITKAVVTKALDEKLPHYLKQMKEFEKNAISDAFCQAADEIRQAKQSELKAYQLSDYEADIIEKIRSANAFNMLRLFMGVNKKLSPR